MKITQASIKGLKYSGNPKSKSAQLVWDDDVRGLGIRIYPSERKTFVVSYRNSIRQKRWITLGNFGTLTLQEARKRAKKILVQAGDGLDPAKEREEQRKAETMAQLCADYIERHAKVHKKTWEKDQAKLKKYVLPAWKNERVDSITRAHIAELHSKIGRRAPYAANRLLEVLKKMFNLAVIWGYIPEASINPATKIQRFKEKKRDRWVTHEEMPKLLKSIDEEGNIYVRSVFWLYLLTGARKSELLNAKWDDINFERKELRIAETKAGRIHYVPLSSPAMEIIEALPRLKDNPFLLPGNKPGSSLVNMDKPWGRVRKRAGIEDVRLHDLRRTVGSWMAESGVSLLVIGKTLDHSNPVTTQIYARLSQDPVREALEKHGNRILDSIKSDTRKVIEFKKSS
jgi:integrase